MARDVGFCRASRDQIQRPNQSPRPGRLTERRASRKTRGSKNPRPCENRTRTACDYPTAHEARRDARAQPRRRGFGSGFDSGWSAKPAATRTAPKQARGHSPAGVGSGPASVAPRRRRGVRLRPARAGRRPGGPAGPRSPPRHEGTARPAAARARVRPARPQRLAESGRLDNTFRASLRSNRDS